MTITLCTHSALDPVQEKSKAFGECLSDVVPGPRHRRGSKEANQAVKQIERDWYDFVWYTARRTPVNYALFSSSPVVRPASSPGSISLLSSPW